MLGNESSGATEPQQSGKPNRCLSVVCSPSSQSSSWSSDSSLQKLPLRRRRRVPVMKEQDSPSRTGPACNMSGSGGLEAFAYQQLLLLRSRLVLVSGGVRGRCVSGSSASLWGSQEGRDHAAHRHTCRRQEVDRLIIGIKGNLKPKLHSSALCWHKREQLDFWFNKICSISSLFFSSLLHRPPLQSNLRIENPEHVFGYVACR